MLEAWRLNRERIALTEHWRAVGRISAADAAAMAAEDRDLQAGVHGDIHALLGELSDAEREAIWPRMGADERAEFDHEHLDWLRAELRRLDARIAFLHESAPEMPSPQLKAAMASAAEDWGDFVADCSRAEEKALGLDVRLRGAMKAVRS